jgi:hypothetical protein
MEVASCPLAPDQTFRAFNLTKVEIFSHNQPKRKVPSSVHMAVNLTLTEYPTGRRRGHGPSSSCLMSIQKSGLGALVVRSLVGGVECR